MHIGELLVHEGTITTAQLETALHAQVLNGGRIGTNLVELSYLDLDTLTVALGRLLGVPAALHEHFQRVAPTTIGLLPSRVAQRHQAVPLVPPKRPGEHFVVAFGDPLMLSAVDEIAFALGAHVQPWVAAELRMLYSLERFYGLRRSPRYVRVDAALAASRPTEGVERRRVLSATGLSEPPPLVASAPPTVRVSEPPSSAVAAPAEPAVPPIPVAVSAPVAAVVVAEAPPAEARPVFTADEAAARLTAAASREEIGDALTEYLRAAFGCGLVLIVREGMALGWKGHAPGADAGALESVAIALGAPSMLAAAHDQRHMARGVPAPQGAAIHARLWKLLRCSEPREAVVVPIVLRDRVINIVYAHDTAGVPLADEAVLALDAVCGAATAAYARLIQRAKVRAMTPAEPAPAAPVKRGWKA